MSQRKRGRGQVNEGIQANNVVGEVIAVGHRARASKGAGGTSQEVAMAMSQLRSALEALNLQAHAKAAIGDDLAALQEATESTPSEPERAGHLLQSLTEKLKMVGVVLSEAVALSEPMRKIAELLGIPLPTLGLQ